MKFTNKEIWDVAKSMGQEKNLELIRLKAAAFSHFIHQKNFVLTSGQVKLKNQELNLIYQAPKAEYVFNLPQGEGMKCFTGKVTLILHGYKKQPENPSSPLFLAGEMIFHGRGRFKNHKEYSCFPYDGIENRLDFLLGEIPKLESFIVMNRAEGKASNFKENIPVFNHEGEITRIFKNTFSGQELLRDPIEPEEYLYEETSIPVRLECQWEIKETNIGLDFILTEYGCFRPLLANPNFFLYSEARCLAGMDEIKSFKSWFKVHKKFGEYLSHKKIVQNNRKFEMPNFFRGQAKIQNW